MPTGRSTTLEVHQPAAMSRPTALPVTCHGHLPGWSDPRDRKIQRAPTTQRSAMTSHGEIPRAVASVGEVSFTVMVGTCSDARSGPSTPRRTVVAPRAKPRRITTAPTAPSPTRYHVLPEQPPASTMPAPNTRPPVTFDSQWKGRTGTSTRPEADSACTPAMATRRARAYARIRVASPIRNRLASARIRQNPPRWMTYPKAPPMIAAERYSVQAASVMRQMLAKTRRRVKDGAASLTEGKADATVPEMVSRSARALFYGVAATLLTGCASGSGTPPPKEGAVPPAPEPPKVTLTDVKSTQDAQAQEIARLGAELKAQDAQQSFLVAELKTLSEQVAKLKASLEEAESAVRSMRATPVAPESRPAAPPAPPPGSAPAIVTPPAAAPAVPAPSAAPTPSAPPAPPSTATPTAAAAPRNLEAERMFAGALARFRAGDDGQAALEFTEFVSQYPTHPQAAASQNYIGDAYYRQRDYRQAATEFQKTVDTYTQPTAVSEALLKIGLCQRALGDMPSARAAWERVVKDFPRTDAARQAR